MDSDTVVGLTSAGGPILIVFTVATYVWKEWRATREERRNASRVAAESDSAVVAATKDVVDMIRAEITVAIKERSEWRTRALEAEDKIDQLESAADDSKYVIVKLRRQLREFRNGNVPAQIPEETAQVS